MHGIVLNLQEKEGRRGKRTLKMSKKSLGGPSVQLSGLSQLPWQSFKLKLMGVIIYIFSLISVAKYAKTKNLRAVGRP